MTAHNTCSEPHACHLNATRNSRPHALTPQSYVVFTQLHTDCSSFYLPRGIEARVGHVRSGDRTRTSCTHERTCVGAANTLTIWASQTDRTIGMCTQNVDDFSIQHFYSNSCRGPRWDLPSTYCWQQPYPLIAKLKMNVIVLVNADLSRRRWPIHLVRLSIRF